MEKLISPSVWNYCDFIYLFSGKKKVDSCQWGNKKTQSKSETVNLHDQLLYFQKFLFYLFKRKERKTKQNKKKAITLGAPLFLRRCLLENKLSRHLKELSVLIP